MALQHGQNKSMTGACPQVIVQWQPGLQPKAAWPMSSFQVLAGDLQGHSAMCSNKQRVPTATCCCRLVVMSATLGGGVGPKVAQLLAQALPQRYEAVGVAEAGLNPAQEGAGGRTAAQAGHVVTSMNTAGGVAAPFLVSQGRSFRVRTEYLGVPGAASGDRCWVHTCEGSRVLDILWVSL